MNGLSAKGKTISISDEALEKGKQIFIEDEDDLIPQQKNLEDVSFKSNECHDKFCGFSSAGPKGKKLIISKESLENVKKDKESATKTSIHKDGTITNFVVQNDNSIENSFEGCFSSANGNIITISNDSLKSVKTVFAENDDKITDDRNYRVETNDENVSKAQKMLSDCELDKSSVPIDNNENVSTTFKEIRVEKNEEVTCKKRKLEENDILETREIKKTCLQDPLEDDSFYIDTQALAEFENSHKKPSSISISKQTNKTNFKNVTIRNGIPKVSIEVKQARIKQRSKQLEIIDQKKKQQITPIEGSLFKKKKSKTEKCRLKDLVANTEEEFAEQQKVYQSTIKMTSGM